MLQRLCDDSMIDLTQLLGEGCTTIRRVHDVGGAATDTVISYMSELGSRCAAWTDKEFEAIPNRRPSTNAWQQRGPPSYIVSHNNEAGAGGDEKTVVTTTSAGSAIDKGSGTVVTQLTNISTIETMIVEKTEAMQKRLQQLFDLQIRQTAEQNQAQIDKLNAKVEETSNQITQLSQSLPISISHSVAEATNARFESFESSLSALMDQVRTGFEDARRNTQPTTPSHPPSTNTAQFHARFNNAGFNSGGSSSWQQEYQFNDESPQMQQSMNYSQTQSTIYDTPQVYQNYGLQQQQQQQQYPYQQHPESSDQYQDWNNAQSQINDGNNINQHMLATSAGQSAPPHRKVNETPTDTTADNESPLATQEDHVEGGIQGPPDTPEQPTQLAFQSPTGYTDDDEIGSTESIHWLVDQATGKHVPYTAPTDRDEDYMNRMRMECGIPSNPNWPNGVPLYLQQPPPFLHYSTYGHHHPMYQASSYSPPLSYWDQNFILEQERLYFIQLHPQLQNSNPTTPASMAMTEEDTVYDQTPDTPHRSNRMEESYDTPNATGSTAQAEFSPEVTTAENLANRFEKVDNNDKIEASGQEPGGETE